MLWLHVPLAVDTLSQLVRAWRKIASRSSLVICVTVQPDGGFAITETAACATGMTLTGVPLPALSMFVTCVSVGASSVAMNSLPLASAAPAVPVLADHASRPDPLPVASYVIVTSEQAPALV